MPRRSRRGSAGLIFHVLNRGAKGAQLFEEASDYSAFEDLLLESAQTVQIPLLAYCLMPNHWHLVLWPHGDNDLSRLMHVLTTTHAQRWNSYRNISGTGAVYQGRFKAIPVQSDQHFLVLCRYVERNPLRAGLVAHVTEWRWSSLWRRFHRCDRGVLAEWPIPRPEDWINLVQGCSTSQKETAQVREAIRRNVPLGTEYWRAETAKRLDLPVRGRGRPKRGQLEKTSRPLFD